MTSFYSGIGSRNTPKDVLLEMEKLAISLELKGYCLRSGGADGADQAFERGVLNSKHIYLPWKNFCGNKSIRFPPKPKAFEMASEIHPNWNYLKHGAKLLHARNMHQVLGDNLDIPSDFVLCWTPDGAESESQTSRTTGGTGSAIRLADRIGIPVVNLFNKGWKDKLGDILNA